MGRNISNQGIKSPVHMLLLSLARHVVLDQELGLFNALSCSYD